MREDSRIFVAGHGGLAGSAILRRLNELGYRHLVTRTRSELDLTEQARVREFMRAERPEYVFLAAAKVGGIHANSSCPAEFIQENLSIEINVIDAAYRCGVRKLMFLGASCMYPKHAEQPIREESLLSAPVEPTNEAYALAKIAGLKMCEFYNRQYGCDFLAVMPANLYGPNDNFDPAHSHVIPALIRRFHEAKLAADPAVVIWGSGTPRREFLSSEQFADACVYLMRGFSARDIGGFVNVGTGIDVSIRDLAQSVARVVGYEGILEFDSTKPDGAPRKLLDVSRLTSLGWTARDDLEAGLEASYREYLSKTGQHEHAVTPA